MECESICISDSGAVTVRINPAGVNIHPFLSKDFMKNRFFPKKPSAGMKFTHKD
jgi:hypothetical protein